jgi:ribosomal protein L7/L12
MIALAILVLIVLGVGIGSAVASASNAQQARPYALANRGEARSHAEAGRLGIRSLQERAGRGRRGPAAGKKIRAIKYYREATGVGLKEAKDFVEEVQRRTAG